MQTFLRVLLISLMVGLAPPAGKGLSSESGPDRIGTGFGWRDMFHVGQVWEGSSAGRRFSEQNHRLAGFLLVAIGLGEVVLARGRGPVWLSAVLPASMMTTGLFLLVWSDHNAWPIGQLNPVETFFGQDSEIIQHKWIGLSCFVVGGVEGGRRLRRLGGRGWPLLLPCYAIFGGVLLMVHHHGHHPLAHEIAQHHVMMGILALLAGGANLAAVIRTGSQPGVTPMWSVAWGVLVVLIGILLIGYQE